MYRRFYATKSSESNSTHAVNGVITNGHWWSAYMHWTIKWN
jgi:hypothetical protein